MSKLQPGNFSQQPTGPHGYPPVPAPPPPKQSMWRRFRGARKRTQWGIGCGTLLFLLALCSCVGVIYPSALGFHDVKTTPTLPTATTAQTSTPTPKPTMIPTTTPKPTGAQGGPSVPPITHDTPHLGGPISDFVGKYGPPNDHSDTNSYHWQRAANGPTDGLIVSPYPGTHNAGGIIVASINGATWTPSTAEAICAAYAPSDAHTLKRVELSSTQGYDVLSISSSLASRFSADAFTDANQNVIQAGTFDIQYLVKPDGSIDSCDLEIGQQQTH